MLPCSPLLAAALLQPVAEGPPAPPIEQERPLRSERAASEAAEREAAWTTERRRLQIHTGLSGAFAGLLVLTGTLLMVAPGDCNNPNCEVNLARLFTGLAMVFPLSTIPITTGIVWGVRLHRHNRKRPTAMLHPRAGGFVLSF
jgi:hypothetical protein